MAIDENTNKKPSKGFAGLSSLVSDVDTTPPPQPPPPKQAPSATPSADRPVAQGPTQPAQQQARPSPQQQAQQKPATPSSGSSGWIWVIVIIGAIWLFNTFKKTESSSPSQTYSSAGQSASPNNAPPAQAQAPSRPEESMPPIGQNLVHSMPELRYCLAENMRLEGAKPAVDSYSDSDINRFNGMVADYNSRCSNFRYHRGALENAQKDLAPYTAQLAGEGRARFETQANTSSNSNEISTDSSTIDHSESHSIATESPQPTIEVPTSNYSEEYAPSTNLPIPTAQNYTPENWTWGAFRRKIGYINLDINAQEKAWNHYKDVVIPITSAIEGKNIGEEQNNFSNIVSRPGVLINLSGYFLVNTIQANIRELPSSSEYTKVIETIDQNTYLAVIGYSGDYFRVITPNEKIGYIHRTTGQYINK